ncbi:MAG: type II toxin-antitoxin system VapC family toxin [Betaproteobacteria bacterium]|nr:type II toxin-antitoxin system VapC family toxin [Betaproteobacteria bacterium]
MPMACFRYPLRVPILLHQAVKAFIQRVHVLPWDSACAVLYGHERAKLQSKGLSLSSLDMMIAAHAKAIDAVLVTNDQSMLNLPGWKTQDKPCAPRSS